MFYVLYWFGFLIWFIAQFKICPNFFFITFFSRFHTTFLSSNFCSNSFIAWFLQFFKYGLKELLNSKFTINFIWITSTEEEFRCKSRKLALKYCGINERNLMQLCTICWHFINHLGTWQIQTKLAFRIKSIKLLYLNFSLKILYSLCKFASNYQGRHPVFKVCKQIHIFFISVKINQCSSPDLCYHGQTVLVPKPVLNFHARPQFLAEFDTTLTIHISFD